MATVITLDSQNSSQMATLSQSNAWVVACLCAAWCDVCSQYRSEFDRLATMHEEALFVWIDIEDQADLLGDIDIDNFPTILVQRADKVAFFGTMQPSITQLDRLFRSLSAPILDPVDGQAHPRNTDWQKYNLRDKFRASAKNT